jgi:hypothetical protein
MESPITRRGVILAVSLFVVPTVLAALLGGVFWMAAVGMFGLSAVMFAWCLDGPDGRELDPGDRGDGPVKDTGHLPSGA